MVEVKSHEQDGRRVFYIELGDKTPEEAEQIINKIKEMFAENNWKKVQKDAKESDLRQQGNGHGPDKAGGKEGHDEG